MEQSQPEQTSLLPDAIRPAKGEHILFPHYYTRRYICTCPRFEHVWMARHDEDHEFKYVRDKETKTTEYHPRRCPSGNPWVLDRDWVNPNRPKYVPPAQKRSLANFADPTVVEGGE